MAKKKSKKTVKRKFTQSELDGALNTLDLLIQNDPSPKKSSGRINRLKLEDALRNAGIAPALAIALVDQLIEQGVFRRGKKFSRIETFTPFVGEQTTKISPNEYLHTTENRWISYVNKRRALARRQRKPQQEGTRRAPKTTAGKTKDQPCASSPSGALQLFQQHDPPLVKGRKQNKLTAAGYDVLFALCNAGEKGLTKDTLVSSSRHGDARGILYRLAKSSAAWRSVIDLPGKSGGRYRVL